MQVGKMSIKKDGDDFEATFSIAENEYSISFPGFNENQETEATTFAGKISEWLAANFANAKLFAAKKLIELKNGAWLEENEEPISVAKFADSIKFSGIIAFAEGSFEIYFDDDDIFWGHLIRVDVDKDFEFDSVDIVG